MLASDLNGTSTRPSSTVAVRAHPWALYLRFLAGAAFFATMVAYVFPFLEPSPFIRHPGVGLMLFLLGFVTAMSVPTGILYLASFSLPLIAAFVGLLYQLRGTKRAALGSFICAMCAAGGLVTGYMLDPGRGWAFGYFSAVSAILVAVAATAVRLIGGRELGGFERQTRWAEIEPALSASQEILRRSLRS